LTDRPVDDKLVPNMKTSDNLSLRARRSRPLTTWEGRVFSFS
jgi:hypothetical protein